MNMDNLSIEYAYRAYRLLIFEILLLLLIRFTFDDLDDVAQLKYSLAALVVFMFVDTYYPSVTIVQK